jgi:tRNA pseudouridine38-40 synthase
MARYKVVLAYDGAGFFGFQRQASGLGQRTVQGEVEAALRRIGWAGRTILSAGRTDTGVHAAGQVIAFDLDWAHTPEQLLAALNANLPPDVAARQVQPAADDFRPRYDARQRRYRYRLFCQPQRDPLRERYAWRVWPPLDAEKLHRSAAALIGTHDFAAFGTPPRPGGTTVRQVFQANWQADGSDSWAFEIVANAFLFHMVRRLVGFQVAVAQGREAPETVQRSLEKPQPARVRTLAPPHGLTLMEVVYTDEKSQAPAEQEQEIEENL